MQFKSQVADHQGVAKPFGQVLAAQLGKVHGKSLMQSRIVPCRFGDGQQPNSIR
jgi:hypothetical protein